MLRVIQLLVLLILETGAKILVPLFVNQGDTIKIDTRTGEYISRV